MKAVVIGATGATGRALVKHLLDAEWISEVTVLVRRKCLAEHKKLREILIDFNHLQQYKEVIQGDVAFSCLGTTLKSAGSKDAQWLVDYTYQYNFAQLAYQNGVEIFVLQSALNADPTSRTFYSRMKGELEENLKLIGFEQLILCKPSFLIRPQSTRVLEKVSVKIFQAINYIGLFEDYKPLSVDKVARAMVQSILTYDQRITEMDVKEILRLQHKI